MSDDPTTPNPTSGDTSAAPDPWGQASTGEHPKPTPAPPNAEPVPNPGAGAPTAPPTFSMPSPSTPSGPPSAPAPAAPARPAPPEGSPVRGSIATIGVLALLAVIAVIVWGGGERGYAAGGGGYENNGSSSFPGGARVGTDSGSGATPGGVDNGSGPATQYDPGSSEPTVDPDPLDPSQIAPDELQTNEGILAGVSYEWRIPGRVDHVTRDYLDDFPQAGYEMSGGLPADHPSGNPSYVYIITITDQPGKANVGSLNFLADPSDPQNNTIVGLRLGR